MLDVEADDLAAIFFGDNPKRHQTASPDELSRRHLPNCLCDTCDIGDNRATARVSGRFDEARQAATVATNHEVESMGSGFVANVAACHEGQNSP